MCPEKLFVFSCLPPPLRPLFLGPAAEKARDKDGDSHIWNESRKGERGGHGQRIREQIKMWSGEVVIVQLLEAAREPIHTSNVIGWINISLLQGCWLIQQNNTDVKPSSRYIKCESNQKICLIVCWSFTWYHAGYVFFGFFVRCV